MTLKEYDVKREHKTVWRDPVVLIKIMASKYCQFFFLLPVLDPYEDNIRLSSFLSNERYLEKCQNYPSSKGVFGQTVSQNEFLCMTESNYFAKNKIELIKMLSDACSYTKNLENGYSLGIF